MRRNICVLRSGGDFTVTHVQWLSRQVEGLVCISDVDVPGVTTIKMKYDWPIWFSKFELFRPDIEGDLLYFDLDTVIVGDISRFMEVKETTMLSDFHRPETPSSGLMFLKEADRSKVWDYWIEKPEYHIQRANTKTCWGDQGILREILGDGVARWQDKFPEEIVSYKSHCKKGVPEKAKIVCFHGYPRPWRLKKLHWIPKIK